jgi:BON domain
VRDEELERAVKQAFDTPDLKNISIEAKNGFVRLTGTVPSEARRLEAAVTARAVPGVCGRARTICARRQLDTNRPAYRAQEKVKRIDHGERQVQ